MSGPAISWKALDTGAWRSEIVEGGRYQLASPSTVTGNPSLAMQAGQSCAVRVYIGGTLHPDASLTVNGTTPVAILNAIGQPLTGQEKFDLVIEVAMPYGQNLTTTDEPNGSPASPFTTVDQRTAWATANLATLRSGVSTVWGPGDSTEYAWNGPLATDWEGIRGPYLGSDKNPYPGSTTPAELATLAATGPDEIWIANPAVPRGKSKLVVNAARTNYVPPKGEALASVWGTPEAPLRSISTGVLTFTELYGSTGDLSPIIPDYMIPDGIVMEFVCLAGSKYVTSGLAGANIGACLSGAATVETGANKYPLAAFGYTPSTVPVGIAKPYSALIARDGAVIGHGTGSTAAVSQIVAGGANQNPFTSGAMRVRINGQGSKIDDTFVIDGFTLCSMGNL